MVVQAAGKQPLATALMDIRLRLPLPPSVLPNHQYATYITKRRQQQKALETLPSLANLVDRTKQFIDPVFHNTVFPNTVFHNTCISTPPGITTPGRLTSCAKYRVHDTHVTVQHNSVQGKVLTEYACE